MTIAAGCILSLLLNGSSIARAGEQAAGGGIPERPVTAGITVDAKDAQQELLALINQSRKQSGLPPLRWDDKLARAALKHAFVMADKRSLSHQFPGEPDVDERIAAQHVRALSEGENVAFDRDILNAHLGLMHSAPHRANLLDPEFDTIGIGVVQSGARLYIAEDFAKRS